MNRGIAATCSRRTTILFSLVVVLYKESQETYRRKRSQNGGDKPSAGGQRCASGEQCASGER